MKQQALPPREAKDKTRGNFENWKKDKQKKELQARAKASKPEPEQINGPEQREKPPQKKTKPKTRNPKPETIQDEGRVTFTDHMGNVYVKPEDSTMSDEDWLEMRSILADDR